MNAAYLFLAGFAVVFLLAAQSLWINNGRYAAAFGNSLAIGACQLVLFKLTPFAQTAAEVAGFLLGGPFGVVLAMYLLRHLHRKPEEK